MEAPEGVEGKYSAIPAGDWQLEHLVLNIRHGDRTAIHRIDNSFKPPSYENENSIDLQSSKIYQRLRVASKFRVSPLPSIDIEKNFVTSEGYSITNYNPIDSFLLKTDKELHSGQLTTIGFYQHIILGEYLNSAYYSLLERIQYPGSAPLIAVRSTSYNRTIQSVAAFLSTLLPPTVQYSDVEILYQPHSSLENMHGFVSNKYHVPGIVTAEGEVPSEKKTIETKPKTSVCPRAMSALRRSEKSYEATPVEVQHRLENVFGAEAMGRYNTIQYMPEVADPMLTSFCHQAKYPCGRESSKCGSDSLLRAVMIESDKSFCERFTSNVGGQEYTRLDIYPFMKEIRDSLVEAARESFKKSVQQKTANRGLKNENGYSPLLRVFSGHDTVIAPVLASLGVYQHSTYCKWPNYASRIAFEAWSPTSKNRKRFASNPTDEFSLNLSTIHVRVIYNGEDVTSHISSCRKKNINFGKGANRATLCPIQSFVDQIDTTLGSSNTIEEACA